MMDSYDAAIARRQALVEIIAESADEIARIDAALPTLQSQALEADLESGRTSLDCLAYPVIESHFLLSKTSSGV